jgi:alpha-ketoglutarate-dependent taurine dioxygenase
MIQNAENVSPEFSQGVRRAPVVRVHPVTGWKSLFVNRAYTRFIEGVEPAESHALLSFLFDLYERNPDIQVRFRWTAGASALWDERISIHCVSWDWSRSEGRHGTRVASEAQAPIHDPAASSRMHSLQTPGEKNLGTSTAS